MICTRALQQTCELELPYVDDLRGACDTDLLWPTLTDYHGPTCRTVGATIRLGGQVGKGSIRQLGASTLEFDVVDDHASVRVRTTSIPPQMFREEIGVVVEGTMTKAGYFESKRLMVSHGNEYQAPSEAEGAAIDELMRSVREGDGRTGGPATAPAASPAPRSQR